MANPLKPLANAPLWPPDPNRQQAASPGPQPQEQKVKAPPAQSPTQDNYSHHSSPSPGMKQTPYSETVPQNTNKKITKMPPVPMHKTKHSEPVGRPKNRNPY
jgi:hypothetical protein